MMEAGREMDALVAEKVMGWKCHIDEDGERWMFLGPSWDKRTNVEMYANYPFYSADIAAAWEVVEKMREQHGVVRLATNHDVYECEIWDGRDRWAHATADSAAGAICKAALEAMRARVSE